MKKISFMIFLLLMLSGLLLFAMNDTDFDKNSKRITIENPNNQSTPMIVKNYLLGKSAVLFSQLIDTVSASGCACQLDSIYPLDGDIADDIFPTGSGWLIDSITTWWSNWNGFITWDSVPNFHFIVYEDSGLINMPKNTQIIDVVIDQADYTVTGTSRIDCKLQTPVIIPADGRYWIEVQPSNVFSVNGQTGIMAQSGAGNGQEFYIKFPTLGYSDWTTATTVFGAPNEIGIILYGSEIAKDYFWNFETGPQGWTHTNGTAFPGGWMVEVSDYRAAAMSPEPGDSSMWIDSETYGAIGLIDTCYSPAIKTPLEMKWLRWGCGYIHAGNDTLTVGLAICSSGVWINPVEMKRYDTSIGSDILDSVDVYAYNYADSIRVFFAYSGNNSYYASFDNILIYRDTGHDVGISDITSPATGLINPGNHDVIAQINNFGDYAETFDITAIVYDTTDSWTQIFNQTITLTDFPSLTDTLHNFGSVPITDDGVFYTEIFTSMDDDYFFNDTMNMISRTRYALGDVIFEMDAETLCMDNQLLGIEFDGTYFYITGGGSNADPNKVHVLDTLGNLIWTMDQPAHSTSWGWRDITWDGVYAGSDRIDTLYTSVNGNVDKFGIDLLTGTLDYYDTFPGPEFPNRALAYNPNDDYFYTANFGSDCYKFSKDSVNINQAANTFSIYGAAYDTDSLYGDLVWWHTQDGTGVHIIQTDADSMNFTGIEFDYFPTIVTGIAGGLSFYEGFRGADVLFALVQGSPHDAIIGIYVRSDLTTGIEDERKTTISNTLLSIPNRIGYGEMSFTVKGNSIVDIIIRNVDGRYVQEFNNVKPGTILRLNGKEIVSGIYFISVKGTHISEKITFFK